ncbi:MAG: bacillithiol biosynthesis deacetylase BshB1 [Saprospiraceae bacterium]
MKLDILAIGVHPDDIELACSGTLLQQIDQGKKIGILDLTRGELGSRGSAEIRDQEAAASAKLMGALVRENARMADGFFQHTEENLLKIVRVVRRYQPKIVLANAINDRHPDHGRAAKLISDACFLAGLVKIETQEENGQPQAKWRPQAVYHYIQDYDLKPDFVVDISPYVDKKMELIQCFSSQFFSPKAKDTYSEEPATPISSESFIDFLLSKSRSFGRPIGVEHGEGYTVARPVGVRDICDLL